MRIKTRPDIKVNPIFKGYEPFILTADTVLTADTIMADDIKTTNMSRFPRRMTISRKQTGLIQASLRDYVNVVSSRRPQTGSDPIQDLVDEYKAYVTSQGGTIGVTDSDLYDEYSDMITAGEITNTGVNTKSVVNYGLWGFKKDGSDNIEELYSLCKISGNYLVCSVTSADKPLYATTYIDMRPTAATRTISSSISYDKNSFYIQKNAEIVHSSASVIGIGIGSFVYRHRTQTTGRIEFITYDSGGNDTTVCNNNYLTNGQQSYKIVYTRFNDGADKVSIELIRNGTSFQTLADKLCDTVTTGYIERADAAGTYKFTSIKYALL
jgi:hypothetical protein